MENGCTGSALGKLGVGPPSEVQASGSAQRDISFIRQLSFASQGSQGNFQTLGKEKRTPKVNHVYGNSEYVSRNDKMPTTEKQKSKGGLSGVKRGLFGRFESKDGKRKRVESNQGKKVEEPMKQCADILKSLMTHKFGWVFSKPVNPVKLNILNYYQVIAKLIDLGTVKARLRHGEYSSLAEFASNIKLTFSNAMKYNPPGNDVHVMAGASNTMFERK